MFQAIQIAYWLALSTWFGGVFFIAIAIPIILRTIRDADPTLPKVLSVNLDAQHSELLTTAIIGNIIAAMFSWQIGCAAILLLTIIGQWFFVPHTGREVLAPLLRSALFVAATLMLIYYSRLVWPRVQKSRQEYIDHAEEPELAQKAKAEFERHYRDSETVLMALLGLLLALILFSGDIRPLATTISFQ